MATSSSRSLAANDAMVLDSIERIGLGIRDLLRVALGLDPNNIIQRLLQKGAIEAVPRALPQNRAYYIPKGTAPYGGQSLHQKLAVAWTCLLAKENTMRLRVDELQSLLGLSAPGGAHLLEKSADAHRILQVYTPETEDVVPGILRMMRKAAACQRAAAAMRVRRYGFLVLLPWLSDEREKLARALRGDIVPGFADLPKRDTASMHFEVLCVPTVDTLSEALSKGV
jgi:hypothetical protein